MTPTEALRQIAYTKDLPRTPAGMSLLLEAWRTLARRAIAPSGLENAWPENVQIAGIDDTVTLTRGSAQ